MNFLLALLLTGRLQAAATAGPQSGGELRFAIQAEPRSLDPHLVSDEPSGIARLLSGGSLVRIDHVTQKPEPELARSWKVEAGGRRIVFQLREGVSFSNGTPFTAEDVAFTLRRLADPNLHSSVADGFRSSSGAAQAEVLGKYSVAVRFPSATPNSERLFDVVTIVSAAAPTDPRAVLGPFFLEEHKAGSYLLYKRNPHYWKKDGLGRPLPYLASVRVEIQRNREMELMKYRRGELNLIQNLDPESFRRLSAEPKGGAIDLGVSLDSEMIWFNQVASAPLPDYKKAWFTSRDFRLAVSEAINRGDIARIIYKGHATPAPGPVSPANLQWYLSALRPPPRSPQAALERLRKAGFSLTGGVLRDSGGHPVEFSIITNAGNRNRERMASLIQQDLSGLGIKVNVTTLDFPSLIERIGKTWQYEACLLGVIISDLDPNAQMNLWMSSSSTHQWNPGQKKPATPWEAEIDRLMQAQSQEPNALRRKAAFDRVQQIVVDQAPFVYLVYTNSLVAISPAVRNVRPGVMRPSAIWNIEQLALDEAAR